MSAIWSAFDAKKPAGGFSVWMKNAAGDYRQMSWDLDLEDAEAEAKRYRDARRGMNPGHTFWVKQKGWRP